MLHRNCLTALLCLVHAANLAYSAEPQWNAPWADLRPYRLGGMIARTEDAFAVEVRQRSDFPTRAEADAFAKTRHRILSIEAPLPQDDLQSFAVYHIEQIDLRPLIPPEELSFWSGKKQSYALFEAFQNMYDWSGRIEGKDWVTFCGGTYPTRERAEADGKAGMGEIVEWTPEKLPYGDGIFSAKFRKRRDVIGYARERLLTLELCYTHGLPDPIQELKPLRPGLHGEAIAEGAKTLALCYQHPRGNGAVVRVYLPAQDNGTDHSIFESFVRQWGLKVKVWERPDGNVVICSPDRSNVAWKAGPRAYYHVATSYPYSIDAYLAKFPSVWPKGFVFDSDKWAQKEVRRRLEDLASWVEKPEERNCYLSQYENLCCYIEPVPGAPVLSGCEKAFDMDLRRHHFSKIQAWWDANREKFPIRKDAPLPIHRIISAAIKGEKLEPALKALREEMAKPQTDAPAKAAE